jgi:hypothetical protein
MRARQRLSRLLEQGAKAARGAARQLGPACRRLAERLAYRPREIVVVTLLAGGLCGGLAVERWRATYPPLAARLEAEPPRRAAPAVVAAQPRARPRSGAPRCEAPPAAPEPSRRWTDPASAPPRLDLNRVTPRELARLAGISRGLAARIVAARDAFERGEPEVRAEPVGRVRVWRASPRFTASPAAEARPDAAAPAVTPDPEPVHGSADPPPE